MRSHHIIPLFLLLSIMLGAQTPAAKPVNIGIIEFQGGAGIAPADVKTVSEIFRNELVNANVYTVLERGKMDEILKEQSFQQSGCTSTECAVQIGKMLNMQKMMYGTMSKLGAKYYLIITVVDIETSKVEKSVSDSTEGLDDLAKAIKRVVDQLVGGKRIVQSGVSPFLKVRKLIADDIFANTNTIVKEAPYITDAEKVQLVREFKKDFWSPLWLGIAPGFGIGSFTQGDGWGGLVGLGVDVVAWAAFFTQLGISAKEDEYKWIPPTSSLFYSSSGSTMYYKYTNGSVYSNSQDYKTYQDLDRQRGFILTSFFVLFFGNKVYQIVRPIVYTLSFNDAMSKSLGIPLVFDYNIHTGTRYALGIQEEYLGLRMTARY
ncbi:MAG: P13 family porin [Spirochaetes bacterium]|nr:P13 family porin [Spirochaetota bacterium]